MQHHVLARCDPGGTGSALVAKTSLELQTAACQLPCSPGWALNKGGSWVTWGGALGVMLDPSTHPAAAAELPSCSAGTPPGASAAGDGARPPLCASACPTSSAACTHPMLARSAKSSARCYRVSQPAGGIIVLRSVRADRDLCEGTTIIRVAALANYRPPDDYQQQCEHGPPLPPPTVS